LAISLTCDLLSLVMPSVSTSLSVRRVRNAEQVAGGHDRDQRRLDTAAAFQQPVREYEPRRSLAIARLMLPASLHWISQIVKQPILKVVKVAWLLGAALGGGRRCLLG
jgi:hypothetical protein